MTTLEQQIVDEVLEVGKEAHNWRDLSETCLGLAAEGIYSGAMLTPAYFAPPYYDGAKVLAKEGATKEDLARVLPNDVLIAMHNKVATMNGSSATYDWLAMLKTAYENYVMGDSLERAAFQFKKNKPFDIASLFNRLSNFMTSGIAGIRKASEIDFQHYKPFMPSGDDAIDGIIGGWPSDGPIVVFGDTGTGKSHFGAKTLADFLNHQEHIHKTGAVYSFEMKEEHWLDRETKMFPKLLKTLDRLYVSGSIDNPTDLVPEVAAHRFDFIVIDDMDNMVEGEAAPGKYEAVFKIVKKIARLQGIPVMCLSQAKGRGTKAEKFLTKYDAAWSAANEQSAAMLIALQNAGALDKGWKGDDTFPILDDQMQYMMFWKSRDDWPKQRGPGAIIRHMAFDGSGQHKHKIWSGPLYRGELKLHPPARTGG
jgi:KaiC/GvpD/RAD55 family RecA-like ATPase